MWVAGRGVRVPELGGRLSLRPSIGPLRPAARPSSGPTSDQDSFCVTHRQKSRSPAGCDDLAAADHDIDRIESACDAKELRDRSKLHGRGTVIGRDLHRDQACVAVIEMNLVNSLVYHSSIFYSASTQSEQERRQRCLGRTYAAKACFVANAERCSDCQTDSRSPSARAGEGPRSCAAGWPPYPGIHNRSWRGASRRFSDQATVFSPIVDNLYRQIILMKFGNSVGAGRSALQAISALWFNPSAGRSI